MSNTIRTYPYEPEHNPSGVYDQGDLAITAFCGKGWDASVQFTISNGKGCLYAQLNEKQVRDLIEILTNRINHTNGCSATHPDIDGIMGSDGVVRDDLICRAIEGLKL